MIAHAFATSSTPTIGALEDDDDELAQAKNSAVKSANGAPLRERRAVRTGCCTRLDQPPLPTELEICPTAESEALKSLPADATASTTTGMHAGLMSATTSALTFAAS